MFLDAGIHTIAKTAIQGTQIYTTPLISPGPNILRDTLIASGTFTIIDGKKGILTNAHVITDILEKKHLGYVNILGPNESLLRLPFKYAIKLPRLDETRCIDLAFIILNTDSYHIIDQAEKQFFNLDNALLKWISNPDLKTHAPQLWLIHANIDEGKGFIFDTSTKHKKNLMYKNACPYFVMPDLDNIEHKTYNYGLTNTNIDIINCPIATKERTPNDFSGTSGAALWQVIFDENCKMQEVILAGVATEYGPAKKAEFIKCRGPISIYESFYPFCIWPLRYPERVLKN